MHLFIYGVARPRVTSNAQICANDQLRKIIRNPLDNPSKCAILELYVNLESFLEHAYAKS
jgi:hypothetical protein